MNLVCLIFMGSQQAFTYYTTNFNWAVKHLMFILSQCLQVEFGTLSEYFVELETSQTRPFPTFTGDFFPYSDRSDQYWTGFYTTRPHLKYLARRIQSLLRLHSQYFVMTILWTQNIEYFLKIQYIHVYWIYMYIRIKIIQLISLKSFYENFIVLYSMHENFYSMNIRVIFNKKTNELFLFFNQQKNMADANKGHSL